MTYNKFMTFYLKYRPQNVEELDIASVRNSLNKIIESGQIPHAFLFAGPKGTGKTSTARILAKIINCENKKPPCNKCDNCISITGGSNIDIIEMDAASNRGIDDMRALRDIIKLAPAKLKSKVYIIDEAHMLTTEASNALLKTLEEPPAHVYFILATTNPEKLIDTIKSRTTLVQFTKATAEETKRSISRIVASEKITITDTEIDTIIKISKGSFRDAVKLLEQHTNDKNFLKSQNNFDAGKLISFILTKEADKALLEIDNAMKNGVRVESLTTEVLTLLQLKLIEEKSDVIIKLIGLILSAQEFNKVSPIEELPLQIAIIKWCNL